MRKEEIIVAGTQVGIIRKKGQKNIYIRIKPPGGEVTVSTPEDITTEDLKLFVLKKLPEIARVRERMMAQDRQGKREYVSGESHFVWGKPYRLQVVFGKSQTGIIKKPDKIIMNVSAGMDAEARERLLTEWYRQELRRVLESVTVLCEKKTGIRAAEYRIKNMKTRWGTCNTEKRRIWINLQLAKKPPECLEYIVIHELVHLYEKNHTHRFHELVEGFCPAWREAKRILDVMPLDYLDGGEEGSD